MTNYNRRQSKREYSFRRKSKTFRLHPDTIDQLDKLARKCEVSQARMIESLVEYAHNAHKGVLQSDTLKSIVSPNNPTGFVNEPHD